MVTCRSVQERNSGRPTQKGRAEKAADLYLEKNPSQTHIQRQCFRFQIHLILCTKYVLNSAFALLVCDNICKYLNKLFIHIDVMISSKKKTCFS